MSELAEREVKETNVFGETASHKCACLLRFAMLLQVLSRLCVVFLALSINVSMLDEDNNRHMVACLRVGEHVYPTCLCAAR